MLNLPVHWYEGMFLRPQHFQAAERYWTEVIGQSSQLDLAYNYGFASIAIAIDAIGRGEFGLLRASFRMRDGTAWHLDEGQCPDRVSFKSVLDRQDSVVILLAIPTYQSFRENVSTSKSSESTRYHQVDKTIQDENGIGDPQEIQFRRPEFRLMLSTDDTAGYETLEVARVQRSGDGKSVAVLDETFFPPLLSSATWSDLHEGILRSLHDRVVKKHELAADQVRSYGLNLSSQERGDLDRVFFLHELNQANSTLSTLIRAEGVHPFTIYTELCRILGALSIFLPERSCGEVRPYDHNDLATVFRWVRDEIVRRLECMQVQQYETSVFIGTAAASMEARLRQNWLSENWKWYVGARTKDVDAEKLIRILTSSEYVWVLASPSTVHDAFRTAAQGLRFTPLSQVTSPLPTQGRWVYFEVSKSGPVWSSVKSELTLAIEFERSVIANLEQLAGSRLIEFKMRGNNIRVEMCLFAVPSTP